MTVPGWPGYDWWSPKEKWTFYFINYMQWFLLNAKHMFKSFAVIMGENIWVMFSKFVDNLGMCDIYAPTWREICDNYVISRKIGHILAYLIYLRVIILLGLYICLVDDWKKAWRITPKWRNYNIGINEILNKPRRNVFHILLRQNILYDIKIYHRTYPACSNIT